MKQSNWEPVGTPMPESGTSRTMWTGIYSSSGGLHRRDRRASQTLTTFVTEDEITPILDYLVDEVTELRHILDEEPDLYVEPLTAREEYEKEIRECIEWREERPVYWKTMFKNGIDIETFAFTILPEETRKRLLN